MVTRSITIDGFTYLVTLVPARIGLHLAMRLINAFGGAADAETLAAAASQVLTRPELEPVIVECTDAFAELTQVAWKTDKGEAASQTLAKIFDDHFAGKYDRYLKWFAFALRENLGSFFEGLPTMAELAGLGKTASSPSPSPSDAGKTGPSGA